MSCSLIKNPACWPVYLVTFLVLFFANSTVWSDDRANASFYVDTFGSIESNSDRLVSRANDIFNRLKSVSGSVTATAKLVVIDTSGRPWALALADGNVILSRGSLAVIYDGVDPSIGDARLAFTLGHELAHLGSRDLWQQHVFASLSANGGPKESTLEGLHSELARTAFDQQAWRERELKADEIGYVLASLAGFPAEKIFANSADEKDFLEHWEAQTQSRGTTHYGADIRTNFLRMRLSSAESKLDQYFFAVLLAHYGNYADARTLFEDFHVYLPSSQVKANLGYIELQLAIEAMPDEIAYRFWLPGLLDADSGLRVPTRSFTNSMPPAAKKHLTAARKYLEEALALNQSSTSTSTNLAITYHYLGKFHSARAIVEDALELHLQSSTLSMLRALIMVDQEPDIDMWPRAVAQLKEMERALESPPWLTYNLATLHTERGRNGKAMQYWNKLLPDIASFPLPYRRKICHHTQSECEAQTSDQVVKYDWLRDRSRFPVQVGDDIKDSNLEVFFASATQEHWEIQGLRGTTIRWSHATALAVDGTIELIRIFNLADFADLINELMLSDSLPVAIEGFDGELFLPGITVARREGQETEMWLSR